MKGTYPIYPTYHLIRTPNMTRNLILLFIWLAFPFQISFGQNPEPNKQDPIQDSITKYTQMGQYEKVIQSATTWAELCKGKNGPESNAYGAALITLGNALNRTGKSKEAEPLMLQGLEIQKKAVGKDHPDIAKSLGRLGLLYTNMVNYAKAETCFLTAKEIFSKTPGTNLLAEAGTLNNLGNLYRYMGQYPKAEPCFLSSLEINKKAMGEDHPEVANSMNNLGNLYSDMGNYSKAEPYYLKSLEIRKKALGENHPQVASSINNLGVLYDDMGDYFKAETYYLRVVDIMNRTLGQDHIEVAPSLNNLGNLYHLLGSYSKAETYKLKAYEIERKALGEDHPEVATSINNIGTLYSAMGNKPKAETYYLKALEIRKKALGENHPDVAQSMGNLGALYLSRRNYFKAESCYHKALEIEKKALGTEHPIVARSFGNLGYTYLCMGNYTKSESCLLKALEIREKTFHHEHPEVAMTIFSLGQMNWANGRLATAENYFLDWITKKQNQIRRYFPFLSDQEKEKFYESNLSGYQEEFKSFCVGRYSGKKAIAADLYNDQLATKGLLLNSSAKWKHRIKTAGDKKLNRLYDDWENSLNQLNQLLHSTDSVERAGIDSLENKTEKMEKELSLRSENFARLSDKKQVTWKDVQKKLKHGEAAIEIIRILKFGIAKTATDTSDSKKPVYQVKGLTDTIYYAALIVKPESVYPEMVLLKNGNDLEGKHLRFYQNAVKNKVLDEQSFHHFWEKIGIKLGGSTRVYLSPDGVFHHINPNTLFNPKTKKYLLEEKDIRLVTSTKDLVNPGPVEEENRLAELVGAPSYYLAGPTSSISTTERKSPHMTYNLRLESNETLSDLPATKTEVDRISGILEAKGWEVKTYTQEKALEANIKESYKPRVLHIATHGFFQPDSTRGSNPLLHSGLMLAGAGSALKGERKEGEEDGILTAYEAMNLNLDNTDLVVLSACETGLGEIKNGEGVYGLQRAFKVAGARTLIMSLWKVNDEATQELMVRFYKNWLGEGAVGTAVPPVAGPHRSTAILSKRSAFIAAQKELKTRYPEPYYWGAFVMVGE